MPRSVLDPRPVRFRPMLSLPLTLLIVFALLSGLAAGHVAAKPADDLRSAGLTTVAAGAASGSTDAASSTHRIAAAGATAPDVPVQRTFVPRTAAAQAHIPVLGRAGETACETGLTVQNLGAEPAKAVLLFFGADGDCETCPGPSMVECTGLIRPGASWRVAPEQIPEGATSASAYSFRTVTLDAVMPDPPTPGDLVADFMCQSLFFAVIDDCADYRRFKQALDDGADFAGLPMAAAAGPPIAVEVHRDCPAPAAASDGPVHASYRATSGLETGAEDAFGRHSYYAPIVYRAEDPAVRNSTIYVQNTGAECADVEVRLTPQDDCLRAIEPPCYSEALAPGQAVAVDLAGCVSDGGFQGSAWIRSAGPLAGMVDIINRGTLASYEWSPALRLEQSTDGRTTAVTNGSRTLYAPLSYSEYQGWDTGVQVQNLSSEGAAKVKVYFLDRGGDIVTTLVDWVCPRGSQTFFLPVVHDMKGHWVGSIRVESQDWASPDDEAAEAPAPIAGTVFATRYADAGRNHVRAAVAYRLLTEREAFVWRDGAGAGGLESGVGLIGLPAIGRRAGDDPSGLRSEVAITNLVDAPGVTELALVAFDANGRVSRLCQRLRENQVAYLDLARFGHLTSDFSGSAVVSAVHWAHPVTDDDGRFVRNVVGLAAATVTRADAALDTDVPGDELAISLGVPLTGETAAALAGTLADVRCAGPGALSPQPVPSGAARAQAHLPALGAVAGERCDARVVVSNQGNAPTKALLLVWSGTGACASCPGPARVECTGLLRPGGSWTVPTDVLAGAHSAAVMSLGTDLLSEIGVTGRPDMPVADALCHEVFGAALNDCDGYRRFKAAFDAGASFADIPLDRAYGGPIAVEVLRGCHDTDGSAAPLTAGYRAPTGTSAGGPSPADGRYRYGLPLLTDGDGLGFSSTVYVQNTGAQCAQVELWVNADGEAGDCGARALCTTAALDIAACGADLSAGGAAGAGWVEGAGPLAVVVDTDGTSAGLHGRTSYAARPLAESAVGTGDAVGVTGTAAAASATNAPSDVTAAGSTVAYGPLTYSEYQRWRPAVHVQNADPTRRALVSVVFYDRSGDVVETLTDWLCPRGGAAFRVPVIETLGGNWVGSVRVESSAYRDAEGQLVNPPPIHAVAHMTKWHRATGAPLGEALAYPLLPAADALGWPEGHPRRSMTTGASRIAVPLLAKADLETEPGVGYTSELAITNLVWQPGATDFVILLFDQNGLTDYVCQRLNERQIEYVDLQTWGYLPPGFTGSALISAVHWTHEVWADPDDPTGPRRSVVGLGAVAVQRNGTALGVDGPGDESAAVPGVALSANAEDTPAWMARTVRCPGLGPDTPAPGPVDGERSEVGRVYLPRVLR